MTCINALNKVYADLLKGNIPIRNDVAGGVVCLCGVCRNLVNLTDPTCAVELVDSFL